MKYLLLEASESAFNTFRLSVVRHGGLMQVAYLLEECLGTFSLMSSLVIRHYLVWLDFPCFQSHAVGVILGQEVLLSE